jgi:hypothetical protein
MSLYSIALLSYDSRSASTTAATARNKRTKKSSNCRTYKNHKIPPASNIKEPKLKSIKEKRRIKKNIL